MIWNNQHCWSRPSETRIGDIVVKITHNAFEIKAKVWMKVCDGSRAWRDVAQFQGRTYFSHFFYSISNPHL